MPLSTNFVNYDLRDVDYLIQHGLIPDPYDLRNYYAALDRDGARDESPEPDPVIEICAILDIE